MIKKLIAGAILSQNYQTSLLAEPTRALARLADRAFGLTAEFMVDMQATDRPNYAWCMMQAAQLARRLGHEKISAIEFGVAGGNGLAFMCEFAERIEKATGVHVECYGFDTGTGMPEPEGAKDLPYWFAAQQYKMDVAALTSRLPDAKLVLGDIRETVGGFLEEYNPAPIGAIFNDTDYWSSTRESFRLFDQSTERPNNFLPRIFMYLDDIIGSDMEMYGPFNGQLLALDEFNARSEKVKIHLNQNLLPLNHVAHRWQIYYAHLFAHPDYETYVGGELQEAMERALRLR